jgi:hypothetical protein
MMFLSQIKTSNARWSAMRGRAEFAAEFADLAEILSTRGGAANRFRPAEASIGPIFDQN